MKPIEKSFVKVYRFKSGDFTIPKPITDRLHEARENTWDSKCASIIESTYINNELDRRIKEEGLTPEIIEVGAPNVINVNKLPLVNKAPGHRDWMHRK